MWKAVRAAPQCYRFVKRELFALYAAPYLCKVPGPEQNIPHAVEAIGDGIAHGALAVSRLAVLPHEPGTQLML